MSAGQSGCRRDSFNDHLPMSLKVTSPDFRPGENIPRQFTCDGTGVSPSLSWQAPPPHTKSLALIAIDRDSPIGFVHWTLYNLPPETNHLPQGVRQQESLPDGSKQGLNDDDAIGYMGPCPPLGSHRYVFTLYALDTVPNLPPRAGKKQLEAAMEGHVLAAGQLTGRYKR